MRVAFAIQGVIGPDDIVLADRSNAIAHSRFGLPALALQAAGHDTRIVDVVVQRRDGELATDLPDFDGIDVVVVSMWMSRDAPEHVRRAQATGQAVVVDLCDWHWVVPGEDGWVFSDAFTRDHPNQNRDHLLSVIEAANAVTVTTPYIAERLRPVNPEMHVLRNVVDLDFWCPCRDGSARRHEDPGWKPTVGWYGSTFGREDDLATLQEVLPPFLVEHDLGFTHVGASRIREPAWRLLGLTPAWVEDILGLAPFEHLPALLSVARLDIGLVPLADNELNAGKSCLKGMEYAAAGIPYVAQAHPEYERFGAGIVARTPDEWSAALERLLDPQERSLVAADGLAKAAQQDWRVRGHEWVDLFESLVKENR